MYGQQNYKSLLECHTITALVAAFDSKAVNDMELLKPCLAGGNRIINFAGKPSENVPVKQLTKHMDYVFDKFHICFFLSVLKKQRNKHTAHMCGGIKTLKHNVRTTL